MSIEDQVLLTFEYWREYQIQFHIANSWGLSEPNVIGIAVVASDCVSISLPVVKDTSREIEKIQFELIMRKTPNERIALACEMFMSARELFLASLPKNLPAEEIKRQLYFRTYGEHLPDDFFKR